MTRDQVRRLARSRDVSSIRRNAAGQVQFSQENQTTVTGVGTGGTTVQTTLTGVALATNQTVKATNVGATAANLTLSRDGSELTTTTGTGTTTVSVSNVLFDGATNPVLTAKASGGDGTMTVTVTQSRESSI